jgi:hypothetical protein
MIELIKKYPNDTDLGRAVRLAYDNEDKSIELLKRVLALHGFNNYGYPNGLVDRGVLYLESEDGKVQHYQNSIDARIMQKVDDLIIQFLKDTESNKR